MKILYLVTDDWYFLSHRLSLARAARDAGHEVLVGTAPGGRTAVIEREGFRHVEVVFRRRAYEQPLNAITLERLVRIYREEKPDLVHHVSFLPIFYGSLAARRADVPFVVNAITGLGHAFMPVSGRRPLRWAMERAYEHALRGPGRLALFQNEEDRRHFVEGGLVDADDALVIPGSGVDTQRFAQVAEAHGVPRVVHASRMLWSKGVGDTVEAARILRAEGVEHRLLLAGRTHPTNPESIPESRLRAWEDEGILEWVGHTDDMPSLFSESAVVCLPSAYREGIPMALLEASAAGRPIVTTDVPGCREAVADEENGIVVPVRNPRRVAGALGRLLREPELRERMGRAGRERAETRFSKEIVNARTLEAYGELVRG